MYIFENNATLKSESEFYELQNKAEFYKNIKIVGKNKNGELYFQCNHLYENKCSIYPHRPPICRKYPNYKMIRYGGKLLENCGYQIAPRKKFSYFID